jgi:large subunit ribosomal protein L10
LDKSQKQEVVSWVREATAEGETVIFTGFEKLTVADESDLRRKMKEAGGEYKVVKNTLLKLGLADRVGADELSDILVGTTAVSISKDPVGISKTLKEFLKESESLSIKGALLGDKIVGESDVKALADLPSKEQMLGQLAAMLNQPLTQLAGALSAPMRDVAAVLNQLKEQKS